jgi:hypothetical protein
MEEFVLLLVVSDLMLFTVCVLTGFAMGRRSHFWARLLLGCLFVPALVLLVGSHVPESALGPVVLAIFMGALFIVPAMATRVLHGREMRAAGEGE